MSAIDTISSPDVAANGGCLQGLVQRRKTRFWGTCHMVTPRLLNWIQGDGLQVIFVTPLATRPNHYVVRIDSKVTDLDDDEFRDGILGEIYDELEDQFGKAYDEWESDNGRTYERHRYWPAFDDSSGCSWGELTVMESPDTRSESEIRAAIKAKWRARRHPLNTQPSGGTSASASGSPAQQPD